MAGATRYISGLRFDVPSPSLWCAQVRHGSVAIKFNGIGWEISVFDGQAKRQARKAVPSFHTAIGIVINSIRGTYDVNAKQ